jgi:transposase
VAVNGYRRMSIDALRRAVQYISQGNDNEHNSSIWWFRNIVLWIVDIFMEYGTNVEIIPEDYTSRECLICRTGIKTEENIEDYMNTRKPGGRSMQTLMQH